MSSVRDRKSTRLNSSHSSISYAVFCLKKKSSVQTQRNCTGSLARVRGCNACRPEYFFFLHHTATTEIYTLSLHDALPIFHGPNCTLPAPRRAAGARGGCAFGPSGRSEEHTSELQSQFHLVCRLLLEKKNKNTIAAHRLDQINNHTQDD